MMYDAQADCQNVKIFCNCSSVLHNKFDSSTKLFSDLYLVKFLDTSANSFFPLYNYENVKCN